jgi:hypothetical protein
MMTLDSVVAVSDVAAVVLSAAAITLGFFVRATAAAQIDRSPPSTCERTPPRLLQSR